MASSDAAAGTATAGGAGAGRLFIRQTSGLVRELGIPAATGISLASVAVVNTFINFNAGLTDFAKADMYLPLVAGAIIWLVAMFLPSQASCPVLYLLSPPRALFDPRFSSPAAPTDKTSMGTTISSPQESQR